MSSAEADLLRRAMGKKKVAEMQNTAISSWRVPPSRGVMGTVAEPCLSNGVVR